MSAYSAADQKVNSLEQIVEELLKDSPDEEFLKRVMPTAGLKYSKDPIGRINDVLRALHPNDTTPPSALDAQ